jgi:hypothetical protein
VFFMFKYLKKNKEFIYNFLVIVLFCLSGFLMLYKLGDIPKGIHVDEAGSYYDALYLVRYGVDRFLYHNPVYFINYGGGMNALYTYLATISFRLFGNSIWSFRLVAVFVSFISYICYYKMARIYKGKVFSIFVLLFLTILPVYIMKSRWGLESYLLNPMLIISLYFYFIAVEKEKNIWFLVCGILFGISLYTYAISYLIIPLFLVISVIYLVMKKEIKISNLLCLFIPVIILGIPLLLMLLVDKGVISNEIVSDYISIPKMWFYRGSEISLLNIKYIFKDLVSIFIGNDLIYNSISKYGTLYYIGIPTCIFGFVILTNKIVKKNYDLLDLFMFILFIIVFGVCLCVNDLNVNKCNAIYICLVYFIVVFLEWLYTKKYRILLLIFMCLYFVSFVSFCDFYFNKYNIVYDDAIFFEDNSIWDAIDYANEIRNDDGKLYLLVLQGYIYPLIKYDISPYEFNDSILYSKEQALVSGFSYYKFCVFDFNEYSDRSSVFVVEDESTNYYYLLRRGFSYKKIGNYCVFFYDND